MENISKYSIKYYAAVCCHSFDGNAYLTNLVKEIQTQVTSLGKPIAHLQLSAQDMNENNKQGNKASMDDTLELKEEFVLPCAEIAVVMELGFVSSIKELEETITGIIEHVSEKYHLSLIIYKKECDDTEE